MSHARALFDALHSAWGPQGWWPARSPFEVCVGAILAQNTAWTNVEKAIAALDAAGALSCAAIAEMPDGRLEELIRPAGTFRVKAARLKKFCRWLQDRFGGDLARVFEGSAESVRERLLELNGIGPETADAMTLYAAGLPTFPADTYARRILARHGWIDGHETYDDIREWFLTGLPRETPLLNEAHALVVRAGKAHCRTRPVCAGCPLEPLLPPGGVREPEPW